MNARGAGAGLVLLLLALAACWSEPRPPAGWQRVFPNFRAPIYDLVRDPGNPDVVYAACGRQLLRPAQQIGGVLRSVDGGRRWVEASHGIPRGTEVLALAFAPPEMGTLGGALVAATSRAGLWATLDGGSSWRQLGAESPQWPRLVLQALTAVEGPVPALIAGSRGQGVVISTDGGETWELRNEGLLNLTIQDVEADRDGRLIVATQYGGVYESGDLGLTWTSLGSEFERLTLAALELETDGTLWVGLQNAGLLTRAPGVTDSKPVGPELNVGVLTIETAAGFMAVGTNSRGALLGRRGGELSPVDAGLENQTVLSLSIDPRSGEDIVLGTWDGLYLSLPPRSSVWPAALAAGLAVFALGLAVVLFRRSTLAETRRSFRTLENAGERELLGAFFDSRALYQPPDRSRAVLERLARRLAETRRSGPAQLAGVVRSTATLAAVMAEEGHSSEAGARSRLAGALRGRAGALAAVGLPGHHIAASQDRLLAAILEAEQLSQLAPLEERVEDLLARHGEGGVRPVLDRPLLEQIQRVLQTLEPIHRLPDIDDRAIFLGQALDLTVKAQARLASRDEVQSGHLSSLGQIVLEALRQLLSGALRSLQQRAELTVELRSRELAVRRKGVVVLEVTNVGRGHALDVEAELLPTDGLRLINPRNTIKSLLRRQSARLEFLVEPRTAAKATRVRLRFRITYGDLDRRGHVLEFADVAQLHRVETHASFRPLHPNPYVVGRPLGRGDFFIGRRELFREITASLRGANQDNAVVLIGQRRMGKTSVLSRLPEVLGDDYAGVLIDLQGLLGSGESAFLYELATTIHDELDALGVALHEPEREAFADDPGLVFRRQFLPQVAEALGERRLLLLFDEFEVLEERIRDGELSPRILPYLRSLIQHERWVSFIFAGTHRLDELTRDYWSVLFNLAIYLDVGYLSAEEVGELLVGPVDGYFDIDPLALEKIHQVSGGHPHFTQLLARELVGYRNRHLLSYVTVEDVRRVAARVVDRGHLHVAYLWEEASRDERLLLLAVTDLIDRDGLATLEAAHHYLAEGRIDTGDLPAALRGLERREILNVDGGLIGFRMELLRLWMNRHHSLATFALSETSSPPLDI